MYLRILAYLPVKLLPSSPEPDISRETSNGVIHIFSDVREAARWEPEKADDVFFHTHDGKTYQLHWALCFSPDEKYVLDSQAYAAALEANPETSVIPCPDRTSEIAMPEPICGGFCS